jgi:hypothetical protein
MPPPTRTAQPKSDIPYEPPARQNAISHSEESEETFSLHPLTDKGGEEKNSGDALSASSVFSSLLPRSDLSRHFPFGHGIGSEELLILAVMLMVFLSGNEKGEVDSEFLLLLGLLLFAG